MVRLKNIICNSLLLTVSLFLSLEFAGYLSPSYIDGLYGDDKNAIISDLKNNLKNFPNGMPPPPMFGWDAGTQSRADLGCHKTRVLFSYGNDQVRLYNGYDRDKVEVILTGDSYTQGAEIEDDHTIGASIFQQSGIVTANVGVGGYNPVQALLAATFKRHLFPKARIVVMGIMSENIERLVSASFYAETSSQYQLAYPDYRPIMKNGAIEYIDYSAYHSIPAYIEKAKWELNSDYWARPDHRFPYSLSFIRALFSHKYQLSLVPIPEKYTSLYNDPYLGENLFRLLSIYAQWAEREHLVPIVFFMPLNLYMDVGTDQWIKKYKSRLPSNLTVKNIDTSTLDKMRYNVNPYGGCHPSHYGAWHIAQQYVDEIEKHVFPWQADIYHSLFPQDELPETSYLIGY